MYAAMHTVSQSSPGLLPMSSFFFSSRSLALAGWVSGWVWGPPANANAAPPPISPTDFLAVFDVSGARGCSGNCLFADFLVVLVSLAPGDALETVSLCHRLSVVAQNPGPEIWIFCFCDSFYRRFYLFFSLFCVSV